MKNLKQLISEIDPLNPKETDLRLVSFKEYYNKLKNDRDKTKFKRLRLLVTLYPNIIKMNSYRSIESIIENPEGKLMNIGDRPLYAFEVVLLSKRTNGYSKMFRVSDLYEYYGIK